MATFVTDAALKSLVSASIGLRSSSDAADNWDGIVPSANLFAYELIVETFAGAGFTPAQIAALQFGETWNLKIGLDYALAIGRRADDGGAETVAEVEARWRDILEGKAQAVIDSVQVDPGGSADVGYGEEDTSTDTFTPDSVL